MKNAKEVVRRMREEKYSRHHIRAWIAAVRYLRGQHTLDKDLLKNTSIERRKLLRTASAAESKWLLDKEIRKGYNTGQL